MKTIYFPSDVTSGSYRNKFVLILLFSICFLFVGCSSSQPEKNQKGKAGGSAAPVTSALSVTRDVPVSIEATGRTVPSLTAGVRSRINGTIESVHFKEGQVVKKGSTLFTIDRRPFQAAVRAKEAELNKNRATLANAKKEFDRYLPASKSGYVSQEKAEQSETNLASATAAVQASEAALDSARLDLEFCTLTAPFTGVTGQILADAGNLIKANSDTPLVTLNQVSPIAVAFDVPDKELADVRAALAERPVQVIASISGTSSPPLTGALIFIDNTVNPSTGNIVLKAEFPNARGELWPGQLVSVSMLLSTRKDAVLVPSQAVQTGQDGSFAYVIREDLTVEFRRITPGFKVNGETVIDKGIENGERVVTDGHLQLVDGRKVDDRSQKKAGEAAGEQKRGEK